jgi:hypothetical protein
MALSSRAHLLTQPLLDWCDSFPVSVSNIATVSVV